jgi:hypothetical protein
VKIHNTGGVGKKALEVHIGAFARSSGGFSSEHSRSMVQQPYHRENFISTHSISQTIASKVFPRFQVTALSIHLNTIDAAIRSSEHVSCAR